MGERCLPPVQGLWRWQLRKVYYLWFEFLALFGLLPALLSLLHMRSVLFATLWIMAIGCLYIYRREEDVSLRELIRWKPIPDDALRHMLYRFVASVIFITVLVKLHDPERMLQLVREKPLVWGAIMLLYPLLSVLPQEMIYRLYFCHRYRLIFRDRWLMMLMSGIAFGHGHLMFNNVIAYSLSMIGGWMFAHTFMKHRSFLLVWIEHAIYGCFIFTIGLGWYFYSGVTH